MDVHAKDKLDGDTISGYVARDGQLTTHFRELASALNKGRKRIMYLRYDHLRNHRIDVGLLTLIAQVGNRGIYIGAFVGTDRFTEHGITSQRRLRLSALRRSTHL